MPDLTISATQTINWISSRVKYRPVLRVNHVRESGQWNICSRRVFHLHALSLGARGSSRCILPLEALSVVSSTALDFNGKKFPEDTSIFLSYVDVHSLLRITRSARSPFHLTGMRGYSGYRQELIGIYLFLIGNLFS